MNYLELCRKLRQESVVAGTGPVSVQNQTGELARMVGWVQDAWSEIQTRHSNWRWMRSTFLLTTEAEKGTYTFGECKDEDLDATITRFASWWVNDEMDYPRIYREADGVGGETYLNPLPWEYFKDIYRRGNQNSGRPAHISVDHQNRLVLGPVPSEPYVITGDYQKSAQILSENGDVPEMPVNYHMLIVYKALEKYAFYESANEFLQRALMESRPLMTQLEQNQLPRFRFGTTLA